MTNLLLLLRRYWVRRWRVADEMLLSKQTLSRFASQLIVIKNKEKQICLFISQKIMKR